MLTTETATIAPEPSGLQKTPAVLGSILECPDVSVDACVVDTQTRDLIFISVWGRDTAIQQLLARLTLDSNAPESLKSGIHFKSKGEYAQSVFFHDTEQLEKRTSREYPGTLFGSVLNLWLFHPLCYRVDRSQHSTYVLLQTPKTQQAGPVPSGLDNLPPATKQRLASALLNLAPFPILTQWADAALVEVQKQNMLSQQTTLLGDLVCYQLHLDVERLEQAISRLIRNHQLPAV